MSTQPRTDRGRGLPPLPESMLPREHALYRPRHSGRQRAAGVTTVAFFVTPLLLFALGVRPPAFENRDPARFPSITDGWGFFTGLSAWADDNLPLRDVAVRAYDGISRGVFGEPPPFGQRHESRPVQAPVPSPGDEDREKVRAAGFPKVIEGSEGWLYLGYDVLGACLPERPVDDVIGAVGELRRAVEDSGRQFVLVVAPDKSTVVPEHLPAEFVGEECAKEARDAFWRRVVDEGGALDIRPALRVAAERRGAPVYSALDTHWTHEGGLAMTRALAEAVQPGVTASWKATPATVLQRDADLPPLIGRSGQFPIQTYDLAPDGRTVQSRVVDKAFREPLHLTGATGRGVVDAKVGMVADSFTLFATQYLSGGFADATVVHSDTAGTDPADVAGVLADSDVVVVEAAERSLVSGINPLLSRQALDAIKSELAKRPR
ncbi:alginate O-acetyltransferase AlgX-related protein [Saccharothrix xinjiangensis]|uniref:AlgX/AlgJ SGNH hydrolase-like domain-containing protein n=1 Tax=Saccharothrix xinjiangensis TaxID=204798 RepID=A0ABV9Y2S4_9PSEU